MIKRKLNQKKVHVILRKSKIKKFKKLLGNKCIKRATKIGLGTIGALGAGLAVYECPSYAIPLLDIGLATAGTSAFLSRKKILKQLNKKRKYKRITKRRITKKIRLCPNRRR